VTEPDIREQLRAIREGLRRAGREMVLSGWQAVLRGALAFAAGAAGLFLEPLWAFGLLGLTLGLGSAVWGALLLRREPADA